MDNTQKFPKVKEEKPPDSPEPANQVARANLLQQAASRIARRFGHAILASNPGIVNKQ